MPLLLGHDATVAEWVGKINGKPFHAPYKAIGVLNPEGRLTGGFVFTGYDGDGVEMSLAGKGCFLRSAWAAVIRYVFGQLKCERLQIHTRRSNKTVCKAAPKLGFVFEGIARCHYGKEDGVCFSIVRNDLGRFIKRWKLQ